MNSHAPESTNFKNLVPLSWDTETSCYWLALKPRVPRVQLSRSWQGSGQWAPLHRVTEALISHGKASILHKGRPSPGGSFPGPGSHPCGHISVTRQEIGLPRAQVSHRKVLLEVLHGHEGWAHWVCRSLPSPQVLFTGWNASLRAALWHFLHLALLLAVMPAVVL